MINLVFYALTIGFILMYLYMFGYKKKQLQRLYCSQWQDIKTRFNFSSVQDEYNLYLAFCDSIPKHWFIGRISPDYYK